MNTSNVSPPLPPAPVRRNSSVPLIVCGIVFFILVLIGGGCFALFRSGAKNVDSAKVTADKFLTSLETGNKKATYELVTSDVSQNSLTDVLEVLAKRHGTPKSHTGPQGFFIRKMNGETRVELNYTEQFQKGEVPVRVTISEQGEASKVKAFNFRF